MNDWYCPYMEKLKDCKFEHGGGSGHKTGKGTAGGRRRVREVVGMREGGRKGGA